MVRKLLKNFGYFFYVMISGFILLEIFLRVFNPYPTRLKGDKIILPVNQRYEIQNTFIPTLDSNIIHTKNSLGFRGPEPPQNFKDYITIITVGGSTTECFYLSDSCDWPSVMSSELSKNIKNIWVNNAGLDGNSTYGHIILLNDYLTNLKPKYIFFLIGCNDIEAYSSNDFERSFWRGKSLRNIVYESEVISLLNNLYRSFLAKRRMMNTGYINLEKGDSLVTISKLERYSLLEYQRPFMNSFEERLKKIINLCRTNKIEPIFITQPILFGFGIDSLSGKDLGKYKLAENLNGNLYWSVIEGYNNVTRIIGKENQVKVIDLSNLMPKNSLYYYDIVHFTNEGAKLVGSLLSHEFNKYLAEKKIAVN